MSVNNLFDERGILNAKAMETLKKLGSSSSCECPTHLIQLLEDVKKFTHYQSQCLRESPQDAAYS